MLIVAELMEVFSRIEMLKAERDEEEFDCKTSFLPAAPSNEEDLHEGYGILLKAERVLF
jgi:hypothetical protein